jgi:hypothetical protein
MAFFSRRPKGFGHFFFMEAGMWDFGKTKGREWDAND